MKKSMLGLLIAAAVSGPLFAAYQYFSVHYIVLTREDAVSLFMVLNACLGGVPVQ